MKPVIYSMSMSLDGYIYGPDGSFDWSVPGEDLYRYSIEEISNVDVHLLGRNLYQTMLYWEDSDTNPELDNLSREFGALWNDVDKVVFSTTLTEVRGNHRFATHDLATEIEQLRKAPGTGEIAVGGAKLAADIADLGLIDEYRIRIHPVLVGGGQPYFVHHEQRVDLELVETRTFTGGVAYLRYRVQR